MPPKDDEEEVEEVEEEISEEETTEEEAETTPALGDLNEDETKEAKSLFNLLKDPSTRNNVLQILAEKAGILKTGQPPATRAEEIKARRAIKEVLGEKLGEKYNFLSGPIAEALEEIFADEREETNRQLSSVEVKQVDTEVERALERLSTKTKGESRKVEAKMVSLMDSLPKSEKISTYDYLEHLYTIASSSIKTATTTRKIADKINRNANDATVRLKGSSSTGTSGEVPTNKKMTLKEAVDSAAKNLKIPR